MTDPTYEQALQAATRLTQLSDDALLEQLGLRVRDAEHSGGQERQQQFSAEFAQRADDMLGTEDLRKIGRLWWKKLEPELLRIVCTRNEEMGRITGGKSIPQIAASLATAGLVAALAPPAWIIVATSILAAKISESGLDAVCEVWQQSLDRGQAQPTPPGG